MKKGLNLGCGLDIKESTEEMEWINVDNVNLRGVDKIWDLNDMPWPFQCCGFYDIILMNDILEHLDHPIKILQEAHLHLREWGQLVIRAPYFSHKNAWGDPQHKHVFSEVYFTHFLETHPRNYCYAFSFREIEIKFIYENEVTIQGMEVSITK